MKYSGGALAGSVALLLAGSLTSHLRLESFTQNRSGLMGNEKREKASGGRYGCLNRLQYSKRLSRGREKETSRSFSLSAIQPATGAT